MLLEHGQYPRCETIKYIKYSVVSLYWQSSLDVVYDSYATASKRKYFMDQ